MFLFYFSITDRVEKCGAQWGTLRNLQVLCLNRNSTINGFRNVALSKMLSLISFIFLMYEIEKNSLQDHLRNYMERLKFVIFLHIYSLSPSPSSLFHHFSPKLLFPGLLPPSFLSTSFQVPLPPAFPSPTPWESRLSTQPGAFAVHSPPIMRHYTQRCFRTFLLCSHMLFCFTPLVQITHLVISPLLAYILDFSVSVFVFKIKIIVIQRMLLKTQRIAIWRDLRTCLL